MLTVEDIIRECDVLANKMIFLNFRQAQGSDYSGAARVLSAELQRTVHRWMTSQSTKFGENPSMREFAKLFR